MASVGSSKEGTAGSSHRSLPQSSQQQQGGGQSFQPMDKASSQTVKLNPKLELSHTELLKLLSYMEAELQARDVVIATLKTERIKSLLAYGRGGVHDPVLALQRDASCATSAAARSEGDNASQLHMRSLQDTQLSQLEHLISQQRKAHQRMRHVLREAEKRHSRVVGELEEERRKHEHDTAQGDDVAYALERDRTRLKQTMESERTQRRAAEAEVARLTSEREQMQQQHKQMVLLLLEDRNRLALHAAHYRNRAEQLAKLVSEEKGRIDGMAEGLEEESKKSLQMEAQMEKQLALFDAERQQMRGLLQRRDHRLEEVEALVEKLQRDVAHYQKQLQEAHNVAMFQQQQQQLSVSPPRLVGPPAAALHSLPCSTPPALTPSVTASVVSGVSLSQASNMVSLPSLSPNTCTSSLAPSDVSGAPPGQSSTLPPSVRLAPASKPRPQPPQLPAKPPQLSHQPARQAGTLPPPKVAARVRASSPGSEDSSNHSQLLSSQSLASHPSASSAHAHSYSPYPISTHSACLVANETTGISSPLLGGASYDSPLSLTHLGGGTYESSGMNLMGQGGFENQASLASTGHSKAVQLSATVNSVPVSLPTTGIARAVQPPRAVLYASNQGDECVSTASVVGGSAASHGSSATSHGSATSQVVQLSPRVNVSATGTGKVIASNQGGKFTFQVTQTS
ncbi:CTTNBP2 N-terminal-like protein isoform X2 [Hyalella azteca]|uniref:CTTNBP2 N-terminal-like protein isoform X2 n=1 Tax=Hyalella azteca TaxID=294128 RepID=A0A8B7P8W8_HYAAZ|nr:CTTNBP2 N-terminal-like protein isoform X2 [Hyalella azteca]